MAKLNQPHVPSVLRAPPSGGMGRSSLGEGRVRFAVGLFPEAVATANALQALAERGIAGENINLVANPRAIDDIRRAASERFAQPPLHFARWIVSRPTTGPYPWLYELMGERGEMAGTAIARDQALAMDFHHWALARHADQVHDHLRADGGVLVVRVPNDQEQQAVCELLLRESASGVQTHDLRRPPQGAHLS